jgi:hypothetical protein
VGNAPDILRGHALNRAALDDSELGWRGLRMLNLLHADAYVLLACYEPRSLSDGEEGARGPVLEPLRPVLAVLAPDNPPVETCRRVYYELTGQLYNSVPAPRLRNFRARRDSGLGGSEVAGNVPGLSMVSSGMEVQVDWPDSPTAYVEWVMEFEKRGDPTDPGEARVQIMLPHGAVVSRLTLWIDGEERESAVGFRQQVREAYKSVAVVQRRDPALVSYVGPDRVLLQVFPVTPGRPPMKVKLGISAPLVFRDGKGWLRLPHIVERNLAVPEKLEHAVWAQAGVPLHGSESLQAGPAVDGSGHSLHGKLGANDILDCETGTIWLDAVAAAGTYAGRFENVEATLEMTPNAAPSVGEAILVVDGSKSMAGARIDWRKAVAAIPPGVSVKAFYAQAEERDTPYKSQGASQRAELGEWLAAKKPGGGINPAGVLEAAFEEAQSTRATIVWIHGPQPVTMPGGQSLEQWASHSTSRLIDVQVIPGPNRFVERLDRALGEETAPLLGSAMETVLYVLRTLQTEDVERRYRVATAEKAAENAARPHVVRLAIADAVGRANPVERPRLARLAADARLVTTATSAVVLENRAQYEAHDLDPSANPEWIPAVPEPEEWALLALAALCAVAVFYRKRRLAPQG